jgi:predicted O-linked N-acetylglucosamine transferase (SPINDLY family)
VAENADQYVHLAVRLANDRDWREEVRSRIVEARDVLFENPAALRELEQFFRDAVARARSQETGARRP